MQRRKFVQLVGMGAAGAASAVPADAAARAKKGASPRRALMKVGTQHGDSDEILRVLAALGVNNICSALPSPRFDEKWSAEGLTKLRKRVESFGIKLDMVPLPLSSSYISRAENPNIMLGKSPERDREIDNICRMIRNAAQAGIPAVKYNMSILGVVRTAPTRGRGGALYSTFVYDKAKQDGPPRETGPVS